MQFNIFKGSKLTVRFFLIFLAYSFVMIIFIITITSIIIYTKAPPSQFPGEPDFPHSSPMMEESKDPRHNDPDFMRHDPGFREHDPGFEDNKSDFKEPYFDHQHHKPGPPPEMIKDLVTALMILVFLAVVLSFFFARFLSKYFLLPVSQLANATKKFSKHDFSLRINTVRKDEIGMLARDFNEMAERLEKYENMRKQWIADIAHELRTPISIMQAEIEAVQDSVWPLEMKTMDHLHSETLYIAKTVNDLHLLSMAESRELTLNMEKVSVSDMLLDAASRFEEKLRSAGIGLEMDISDKKSLFTMADPYLLRTVFNNLIENSIRYTNAPGKLKISLLLEGNSLLILFDDTPPGVPTEHLDKIFDRLFRVDPSRSRIHGGSGLGLSTCRAHIEVMGGTITASDSPIGGLRITIKMPVKTEKYDEKRKNSDS